MKTIPPMVRKFFQRFPRRLGIADRFVIHVGEVAHMVGGHPRQFESTSKDILENKRPEIPDVCWSIDSGATAVKTEGFTVRRSEVSDLARHGVEESHRFQRHKRVPLGRFCK